jgi:serine/threonine-protein kinase
MSPEQALGKRSVDARTDLWAVGVMLYEALSGVQPFKADNHHAVLRRIIESEPPPLPSAIPARLRAIVSRCLEKDPARRYQHAAALRADLEAALDDLGASSPAPLALVSRAGAGSRAARTTQAPGALAAPAEHRFRALLRRALSLAEERFRATTRGRTTRTTRERAQSTQKTRAQGEARRRALALTALQIAGAAAIAAAATSAALREPAGEEPREPAPQSLRPVLAAAFAGGSAAKQGGAFTPGGVTRAGVPAGAEVSCDDEAGSPGSAPAGPAGGATALASSGDNPARAISPARGTRRSRITSPGF